ncbi:MAG: cytochrome B6 [Nitrospira sp.]|nr:cytochrome B6 [Nitrospira sp.]
MAEKSFEVFPKNPKKTYGLMELVKGTSPIVNKEPEDTIFTWPNLFYLEFIVALIIIAGILFLSIYVGAPLEEEASRDTTPNPMKAPWYFLGLQEMLVFFDPWIAGVALPVLILTGLMLIPFLDINKKGKGYYTFSERKFAISAFSFGMGLWTVFIVIGVWFRGLDWNWYWPWENGHLHKPVASGLKDLPVMFSRILGISDFAGKGLSDLIVIVYFALGLIIPAYLFKDFFKKLGVFRYAATMMMFWIMVGIPVKVGLRLMFSIKYVIMTPWFKI